MALIKIAFLSTLFIFCVTSTEFVNAQKKEVQPSSDAYPCRQPKAEQDPLVDEAESGQFSFRRIEIANSTYTTYKEFGRHFAKYFYEGDIFTRKALEEGVKSLSKMKAIYPIRMENVEVRLDKEYKAVDIVLCVKQKPKKS